MMKIKSAVVCLLIGLLLCPDGGYAQENDRDTLKVLFVGNSYVYFWNLVQTVETMGRSQGVPLVVRKSTEGGTNWKQHWDGEEGLKSREIIKEGKWDVVILQNHSLSTIENLPQFMEYGGKFIELVKSTGAKPVLYETWARAYNPLMIEHIEKGYDSLASKYGLDVVRVGEIWRAAQKARPDLPLYHPDDSHPSTMGAYLTACAFYTYLTGNHATGLDARIATVDKDGELLYLAMMTKEDAAFLQAVVDTFLKEGVNE